MTPLQSADASIANDIVTVNDFIESVPNSLIGTVNQQLSRVADITAFGVQLAELLDRIFNDALEEIENVIQTFLGQIGLCPGTRCPTLPKVDFSSDLLTVSAGWLPKIPSLEFETLPPELLSLEKMFSPLIDDLHQVCFGCFCFLKKKHNKSNLNLLNLLLLCVELQ